LGKSEVPVRWHVLPQLPVTALLGRPFLAQQDAAMFGLRK